MQKGQGNWKEIEKQYVYLSKIGFALQFDHKILSVMLLLQYSAQVPFNPFARNRPCGSTSFLPFVTSSVLTVKDNFVR